jgi:hypothetical protein
MSKRYLAMDIGCIECGEESAIIGMYATREEAEKAINDYLDPDCPWRKDGRGGQHYEEVFEVNV